MKLAKWACCAVSLAIGATFAASAGPSEDIQHITAAEVALEPSIADSPRIGPDRVPNNLTWQRVQLPFVGFAPASTDRSSPHWARLWVRIKDLPPAAMSSAPRALTYSAFLTTGPQASFYLDGQRYSTTDHTLSNDWNQPVLLPLPMQDSAAAASREITIAFRCYRASFGCGAPSLYIGSPTRATEFYERERLLRIDAPRMGSLAMLFAGIFSLLVWVRRRNETAYMLFFVVAVLWTLRTLHYHLAHYPEPQDWFWWVTINSLTWLAVAVYVFAFRLQGVARPKFEKILIVFAAISSLVRFPPLVADGWQVEWLAYAIGAVVSLAVTILLTVMAVKSRSRESMALAIVLWPMLGMGVHDLLLMNWSLNMERFFLLPFAALPLLAAFLYALASRFRGAIDSVEALNQSLELRLAAQQQELVASYDRLRNVEVHNAQIEERQRLMRDMHDGIGSTLVSTLALVERGNSTPEFVARSLREAVDELKLAIDSLEETDHDLVTLLATLRYRLTPRLQRAGLTVDWRVEDIPPLPWLDARSALQILRIVQECISNVLKHAQATRIEVAVFAANNSAKVRIADNGGGFDTTQQLQQSVGRGLKNLKTRAQQLGAAIDIESSATGTTVVLTLPVERV